MSFKDKITVGGEIKSQGDFSPEGKVCYIMPVPKSETASTVAVLNAKLSGNKDFAEFPFTSGAWNPVVINKLNVTQQNLTDYRIFWGME